MDEIVFSNEAYNAIIEESFAFDPDETGGILLGHKSNDVWFVMKMIPSGFNENKVHHSRALFKYDKDYVNYTMEKVSQNYAEPLEVLGLWHRHPDNFEHFSSTDDGTNIDFATKYCHFGHFAISGLVHVDPRFRLDMYLVGPRSRSLYEKLPFYVGDYLIPEEYTLLKHIGVNNEEVGADLNPMGPRRRRRPVEGPVGPCQTPRKEEEEPLDGNPGTGSATSGRPDASSSRDVAESGRPLSIQRNLQTVMSPADEMPEVQAPRGGSPRQKGVEEESVRSKNSAAKGSGAGNARGKSAGRSTPEDKAPQPEGTDEVQAELKSILHTGEGILKKNAKTLIFIFLLLLCFLSYKRIYNTLKQSFGKKEIQAAVRPGASNAAATRAQQEKLMLVLPRTYGRQGWASLHTLGWTATDKKKTYIVMEYSGKQTPAEALRSLGTWMEDIYLNTDSDE